MARKKINKNNIEVKTHDSDKDELVTKGYLRAFLKECNYVTKDYLDEVMIAQRKEYERYVGALHEDTNDKFKSLGEGISMILERGVEDSEKNRKEHEWFKMKIARLDAKVF
jgi:mannitol/fructose-specific phosphotransferase system IIA component